MRGFYYEFNSDLSPTVTCGNNSIDFTYKSKGIPLFKKPALIISTTNEVDNPVLVDHIESVYSFTIKAVTSSRKVRDFRNGKWKLPSYNKRNVVYSLKTSKKLKRYLEENGNYSGGNDLYDFLEFRINKGAHFKKGNSSTDHLGISFLTNTKLNDYEYYADLRNDLCPN